AECPGTHVRAMETDPLGYSPALWRKMADLGWLGFAYPAPSGGGEAGFVDLAVLVEEMGRALLPGPFRASALLGGMLVLRAGSTPQKDALLPALTRGETVLSLAHTEPSPRYQPERVTT